MNQLEKATIQAPEGVVRKVLLNNFLSSGIEINLVQYRFWELTWIKHPWTMLDTSEEQLDILGHFVNEVINEMEHNNIPIPNQLLYSGWLEELNP